jgi:hypothetical protein
MWSGVGFFGSEEEQVANSCDHGNEYLCCIKQGNFSYNRETLSHSRGNFSIECDVHESVHRDIITKQPKRCNDVG